MIELNNTISDTVVQKDAKKAQQEVLHWLSEHRIFDTLWNPKKTHVELVKASKDTF